MGPSWHTMLKDRYLFFIFFCFESVFLSWVSFKCYEDLLDLLFEYSRKYLVATSKEMV